jgi:hypothetical protein
LHDNTESSKDSRLESRKGDDANSSDNNDEGLKRNDEAWKLFGWGKLLKK